MALQCDAVDPRRLPSFRTRRSTTSVGRARDRRNRRVLDLAALCVAASLLPGVAFGAVIQLVSVSGAPGGEPTPESAFLETLQAGAGPGVSYGLLGPVGGPWTLEQLAAPGTPFNTFDAVVGHILTSLTRDVEVQVGYGSQAPALFTGVLIDAFIPAPGGLGSGVQLVDMEDLRLFPYADPDKLLQQALLLHGLYELYTSVVAPSGYNLAHGNALSQENNVSNSEGGPQRTNNFLVGVPAGGAPGDWLLTVPVTTNAGIAGDVLLFGHGDPGNLRGVHSGPFDFSGSSASLPSIDGDIHLDSVQFVPVPEPSCLVLVGSGFAALFDVRRRRGPRAGRGHRRDWVTASIRGADSGGRMKGIIPSPPTQCGSASPLREERSMRARVVVVLFLAVVVSGGRAVAGPIVMDTWYEFGFDPNHTPFVAGCQPADPGGVPCRPGIGSVNLDAPPWTFTSLTPVEFTITDGFLAGDFFDVFDLGLPIGSTPSVPLIGSCGLDPTVCVVSPFMSHASFLLPAGFHSVTIFEHEAQILGEGFFEVEPVPEPASLVLLGTSLLGVVGAVRRRRR